MSYILPAVMVYQLTAQQQAQPSVGSTRTVACIADFPIGPMIGRIGPDQTISAYGDPLNPALRGFKGPALASAVLNGQLAVDRAYDLELVIGRAGCVAAHANVADGLSGTPFVLVGAGGYAGSAGNFLRVSIQAPTITVLPTVEGGFGANATQVITFYQLTGSPTGSATLSFAGTPASAGLPVASITGAGAAGLLQTYLTGITTIGVGNVQVVALPSPVVGSYSFQLTFIGTLAGAQQPLVAVSANVITAGTGIVPVESIQAVDTRTNLTVASFYAAQFSGGWTTQAQIVSAINAAQDPTQTLTALQAITVSTTAGLPVTQTLTLAGGSDGVGVTVATDVLSPDGATSTIPYLLQQIASGAYGNVDFVVTAFDAETVLPAALAAITTGLGHGVYLKPYLGPAPGIPVATLEGNYQTANTDRVVMAGHDSLPGTGGTPLPGWAVAALWAGGKAVASAEYNLARASFPGLLNRQPIDPATGVALSEQTLLALAGAGFTVMGMAPRVQSLIVRDLITTAPQTDQFGLPNRFLRASERDCFDMLALLLQSAYDQVLLQPTSGVAAVNAQLEQIGDGVMQSTLGRYHNGAVVTASFNPTLMTATVSIGYQDRPPLAAITIYLTPQASS